MEGAIETMGQELLGGYKVGRYFRQKKEIGQNHGKNSIQFVAERRNREVRLEMTAGDLARSRQKIQEERQVVPSTVPGI